MAYSCGSPCLPHYTTVFGRTGSEAEFAILLQVPPRAWGTKQRFPLRSRGNLTEGVFKKCRAMRLPAGGGCQMPMFW
jgi:hypothetical protein